jgi:hypothetical protein
VAHVRDRVHHFAREFGGVLLQLIEPRAIDLRFEDLEVAVHEERHGRAVLVRQVWPRCVADHVAQLRGPPSAC